MNLLVPLWRQCLSDHEVSLSNVAAVLMDLDSRRSRSTASGLLCQRPKQEAYFEEDIEEEVVIPFHFTLQHRGKSNVHHLKSAIVTILMKSPIWQHCWLRHLCVVVVVVDIEPVRVRHFDSHLFLVFVSDIWVQHKKPRAFSSLRSVKMKNKYKYLGKVKSFCAVRMLSESI